MWPLNPVFNCSKSLLSFSTDKVTTGSYNLQLVISKNAFVGLLISGPASLVALLVTTQFLDHIKSKEISQLINGMSSVLQKLLKYFNDITILISSLSTSLPSYFLMILVL